MLSDAVHMANNAQAGGSSRQLSMEEQAREKNADFWNFFGKPAADVAVDVHGGDEGATNSGTEDVHGGDEGANNSGAGAKRPLMAENAQMVANQKRLGRRGVRTRSGP